MTRLVARFWLALGCLALGATPVGAAGGPAITDPKEAGPELSVQGEYAGALKLDGEERQVGAQVIALGDNKFQLVLYRGGLPGAGWKRGDQKEKVDGASKSDGSSAEFKGPQWSATCGGGELTAADSGGQSLGAIKRIERNSPTLGAKPPDQALVLFDGSGVEHFPGARVTDDHLLEAGAIGADALQDFTLHIEFRLPFMPSARGQGRANSGVYLQNRYELQVLDSFGLEAANNECGGFYTVREPDVNMCLPPLTWQTYDIEFKAARFEDEKKISSVRVTVRHNGVTIHDNVELPKVTPGGASKEWPGRGPLQLQNHGNPVVFRNIWVVQRESTVSP